MTIEELKDKIKFIKDCQFAFMRANNIRWHYDKDISEGYDAIAETRYKDLVESELKKAELEPKYNELKETIENQLLLYPNDKMLKLLNMYFFLPSCKTAKDIEKHRDKISSLESRIISTTKKTERAKI